MRHLPVVVLTSSTYSPDVKRAYQLGANSFLTKPTDFMELVSELKARCDFWLMGTATPALPACASGRSVSLPAAIGEALGPGARREGFLRRRAC